MINTNTLILVALILVFILAIIFRKTLKKIWFKFPGFDSGIETHDQFNRESYGGRGGDAKTSGKNSIAIGGKGGGGGPGGSGGTGGNAEADGDNVFAMGGEGGEAGQLDRGGKGGRGPLQVLREDHPEKGKEIFELLDMAGITEEEANKYGKGGDGGSSVQQIQRQKFEENKKNYLDPRNSNK